MRTKHYFFIAFFALGAATAAWGQFGGRPGDVVLWALTPRNGTMNFQIVPGTTTNDPQTSARFEVIDINTRPLLPIPPGTLPPGVGLTFRRQLLHEEPDDVVFLVNREEAGGFPHRIYLTTNKTLLVEGTLREQAAHLDAPTSFYVTLGEGIDFGPDVALVPLKVLFWTPSSNFPAVEVVGPDVSGPGVPPGLQGFQVVLSTAVAPVFVPWVSMRRLYPGAGWPAGIDLKLLDRDTVAGNTTQFIRLRQGKSMPLFKITDNTHLFVLQGRVDITANSKTTTMKPHDYAYVPRNFAITLSNPRAYRGPRPNVAEASED